MHTRITLSTRVGIGLVAMLLGCNSDEGERRPEDHTGSSEEPDGWEPGDETADDGEGATGAGDDGGTGDEDDGGGEGSGTEDGSTDDPGIPRPTTLIPEGFGVGVDQNGDAFAHSANYTVRDGRFGTSAVDPAGYVTGIEHRARVRFPGLGYDGEALTMMGEVTDGFGDPIPNAFDLPLEIHAYDGAALAPSDEVAAATTTAVIVSGRIWAHVHPDIALATEEYDVVWLTITLDGDALSPAIRVGAVPAAATASTFAAGGVRAEDDARIPAEAREATTLVRSGVYRPGEVIAGLPDPQDWSCTHRANVLGYPRMEGTRTFRARCKGNGPDVELWSGTSTVAYATVGAAEFPTALEADGWLYTAYAACEDDGTGGCVPRVAVHTFEQTLDYACSPYQIPETPMETSSWDYGPVLDEATDPGAADIAVHVVSTCNYDLTWPSGLDWIDP